MVTLAAKSSVTQMDILRGTAGHPPRLFPYTLTFSDTWYRFIVKKVDPMRSTYHWSEMSFYSKWTVDSIINICFDVPKASQVRLYQALSSHHQPFHIADVYASHGAILDEILALYDESIWSLRDGVRQIEMVS